MVLSSGYCGHMSFQRTASLFSNVVFLSWWTHVTIGNYFSSPGVSPVDDVQVFLSCHVVVRTLDTKLCLMLSDLCAE